MASDNDQSAIEEQFLKSWDRTEHFYRNEAHDWPDAQILTLIAELRQRGYDRRLISVGRPGVFILSPTRVSHHDPILEIYINKNGVVILHYYDGAHTEIKTEVERVEFTPELESLLTRLLAHPID